MQCDARAALGEGARSGVLGYPFELLRPVATRVNPEILSAMAELVDLNAAADPNAPEAGVFVSYPGSPYQLFQPYPPAGDQPTAIAQLVEGLNDGELKSLEDQLAASYFPPMKS